MSLGARRTRPCGTSAGSRKFAAAGRERRRGQARSSRRRPRAEVVKLPVLENHKGVTRTGQERQAALPAPRSATGNGDGRGAYAGRGTRQEPYGTGPALVRIIASAPTVGTGPPGPLPAAAAAGRGAGQYRLRERRHAARRQRKMIRFGPWRQGRGIQRAIGAEDPALMTFPRGPRGPALPEAGAPVVDECMDRRREDSARTWAAACDRPLDHVPAA